MLLEDERIGCENCKKCKNRCNLLPPIDDMLYGYKQDHSQQWDFMKNGVEKCGECNKCADACPSAFKEEYRINGGADKCPQFEEETDPMIVLENMEKGLEMLNDILGTHNGTIPF